MSVYEDYERTSRHYDRTRLPVASEIILGCLARQERPLADLTVLDAGCGTGAYSRAIIDRVSRIAALDLSEGMLGAARNSLSAEAKAGRIAFHRGSILELPFAAGVFDAVMVNQVVHHLGDHADTGFTRLERAVAEFARVLRPGGALVVNHCSQVQLRHAYWYYHLAPRARDAFPARFAPAEALRAAFRSAGLSDRGSFVPLDAVCQGAAYFDGCGPLSRAWRDGDSFWAEVRAEELAAALARVRAMDRAGALDAFVAEHDARRPEVGQITFFCAVRA